ncbi:MAG: Acetyltransferase GNAT family [Candidatus Methanohalarchaeum thermophilum]|uniref:Acetyltransferase GNAT family n=1 Tax=Methanohalarchaeum thermophilum TaxID=1903181 RepID=A0A1Q6DWG8_METT1|nr:MAG: Acetyltransferase GNAT family [Candidatus Methanohalarchaeum thermophilum]
MKCGNGFEVRRFSEDDLFDVLRIESKAFDKTAYSPFTFLEFSEVSDFFYVLDLCGDLVGYILGYRVFDRLCKLASLAVVPRHQSEGFGSILLRKALEEFNKEDIEVVTLTVREGNNRAISLYSKFGFQTWDKIENYYPDKDSALYMVKKLDKQ